jgi:hypothetical protein
VWGSLPSSTLLLAGLQYKPFSFLLRLHCAGQGLQASQYCSSLSRRCFVAQGIVLTMPYMGNPCERVSEGIMRVALHSQVLSQVGSLGVRSEMQKALL